MRWTINIFDHGCLTPPRLTQLGSRGDLCRKSMEDGGTIDSVRGGGRDPQVAAMSHPQRPRCAKMGALDPVSTQYLSRGDGSAR